MRWSFETNTKIFAELIGEQRPLACARINGDRLHDSLHGLACFYPVAGGVLVTAEVSGLPTSSNSCENNIFAFHIHEGNSCTGNATDPFAAVGPHYNPNNCPHPQHAGDLPPLFGNDGYAWTSFFTNRFTVNEVIGRTVIIHSRPDDFTSQPAGNSGEKIACGEIRRC